MTSHPAAPTALARALPLLALAATLLALASPATGATACGKQVINDWYDNGRVDGTYPRHCYDDAIDALPRDVRDYSSAKEDIQLALQNLLAGRPAPPARTDPSPDPSLTVTTGVDTTDDGETGGTQTGRSPDDEGGATEATGASVDTTSSDSVPLPLLVLAGLALLLVAAGSAGYLVRRFQARRVPPTG